MMECLNCGAPILKNGYCSECGLNDRLLAKAYNTSNHYYNIGLDKAKLRDLSGAVDALNLSLKYNKQNIDARNLLGLIYYETGEIVLGLTHWVVSSNYLPGEVNMASRYIKELQSDTSKLQEANTIAKQFNQALYHIEQGMKDLAFIQLKRILSSYPNFVKGYLLLALLYIDNGNMDKAKKALRRVLRIDKNNTLAIKYLTEMGVSLRDIMGMKESSSRFDLDFDYLEDKPKTSSPSFAPKEFIDPDNPDLSVGSYKEINHSKFNLLYVSVGLIVGILVSSVLILPTRLDAVRQETRKLQVTHSEELASKEAELADLTAKIADYEKEIEESENKKSQDALEEQSAKESLDTIKENISETTYTNLCEEANKALQIGDYDKGIELCKVALEMKEDADAYYYLGKAYLGNNQEKAAKEAFKTIQENYPDSTYITEISEYLEENTTSQESTEVVPYSNDISGESTVGNDVQGYDDETADNSLDDEDGIIE